MLLGQLAVVHPAVYITVAIIGLVSVLIREYHKTRRTEIGMKNAKSQHKAEIIEAATRSWWSRPK